MLTYKEDMLVLDKVSFSYGVTSVIHSLDYVLKPGMLYGVLGRNGVGKTTLLKLMSGLLSPSAGVLRWTDVAFSSLSSCERAKVVSYMPGILNLDTKLTVAELVLLARYSHRKIFSACNPEDELAVEKAIRLCSLEELSNKLFSCLSDGEKRRVLIAMSLSQDARVLVLDEPIANLDIKFQFDLLELLRNLADMGKTLVLSVHDLRFAGCCDEVLLLGDGVCLSGSPSSVLVKDNIRSFFHLSESQAELIKFWP